MGIMQQTRYVFHLEQNIHAHLFKVYNKIGNKTQRVRFKLFLNFLSQHEQAIKICIEEFENCHTKQELNRWFKFVPRDLQADYTRILNVDENNEVDEIINLGLGIADKFIDMYSSMAKKSNCESVIAAADNMVLFGGDKKENLLKTLRKFKNM